MAGSLKRVADAVVGLLETGEAAGTFSQAILTERRWLFLKDLEDLAGISVQVVPIGSVRERDSNTTFERYVRCDVLCKNGKTAVDKLIATTIGSAMRLIERKVWSLKRSFIDQSFV
jgi:hypothetical protein